MLIKSTMINNVQQKYNPNILVLNIEKCMNNQLQRNQSQVLIQNINLKMSHRYQNNIKITSNIFNKNIIHPQSKNQKTIQSYYQQNNSYRHMLITIFTRNIDIINLSCGELNQVKMKISTLQQTVYDNNICLEDYRNKLEKSQKQLTQLSILIEKVRIDNASLENKIDQKDYQIETNTQEIKKTFLEVKEESQMDKQILEELYDTQQDLRLQIKQFQDQKAYEQQRYTLLQQKYQKLETKYFQLQQHAIKNKQQIEYLHQQLLHEAASRKYSSDRYQQAVDDEDQININRKIIKNSFNQQTNLALNNNNGSKNKLSQQVSNYLIPNNNQLLLSFRNSTRKKSFDELSQVMSVNNQPVVDNGNLLIKNNNSNNNNGINNGINNGNIISNGNRKIAPLIDPYYSHYILTSQSIKIKQDCQDMLNIDMKPYYKQVIEKRIPMHLWDQWVKNRLRDIIKRKNIV